MMVVTTPTGHVGSRVVRLLLQAGVRPRVLVRDPDRLDPAVRDGVEVVRGDLTDRFGASVAAAVSAGGVGRVVFLSSVGAERRHGVGHIDGLALPGGRRRGTETASSR